MGKITRSQPAARVSRSGLWLIGGVALLSLAVLAWALQGEGVPALRHSAAQALGHAGDPAHRRAPPASRVPGRAFGRSAPSDRTDGSDPSEFPIPKRLTAAEALAARPPSAADYGPLLQGNVFQPRVVPPQSRGAAKSPSSRHPAPAGRRPGAGAPGGPVIADGWHDWKYNGIAQLDQQTYALMDQPDKKQSQFVKVGDHLEDATVVRVAENEVTLREADGSIVRVKQVDTVAEQLRSARAAATAPQVAAPAAAGSAPAVPGPGPITTFPPAQGIPQGSFGRR